LSFGDTQKQTNFKNFVDTLYRLKGKGVCVETVKRLGDLGDGKMRK